MPKNEIQRGLTQEERRRRSANRPIGGGGTSQQLNTRKKDEGFSNTRLQRVSGIIGIVMLVALLLSLVPACYYSQAGAAELPVGYAQSQVAGHLTVASIRSLETFAADMPLSYALAGPIAAASGKLSLEATGQYAGAFFNYWLGHGGATPLSLPQSQ